MMHRPRVLTIVGPESSGKTTLARHLSETWGVPWVPEYARTYLAEEGPDYTLVDLPRIAEGQQQSLERTLEGLRVEREDPAVPHVIVDSGILSVALWAELKFELVPERIEELLARDPTTLYLVLRPAIDWRPDPLRESPDLLARSWIYNHYLRRLRNLGKEFRIR